MNQYTKFNRAAHHLPLPWGGSSFLSLALIVISVVLMVISAFRPQSFEGLRTNVSDIFSPALSTISMPFQQINLFLHDVTNLAQLQADNLRLEQENTRLRQWYQTALLLDSENRSLRELLNLEVDKSYSHISARILSDSGNTYVKSMLASVGNTNGVVKGAAVVAGEGLVGRIVEVGENTSRILLINDINSRVPVVVEDTGQHAIMAGYNERNPKLIHLPEDSKISEGARIITSGYGGVYPHGLPVGRVIIEKNGDMSVILFADFDRLQIIRILKKDQSGKVDGGSNNAIIP